MIALKIFGLFIVIIYGLLPIILQIVGEIKNQKKK